MKLRKTQRAVAGILLCGVGFWLALPKTYREKTYLIPSGGCRLETTIIDRQGSTPQGTVVLFHGISADKKIMFYIAQGFAEQNLRVFVPDLPGHGHSPGPFSPQRAEECGEALVSGLISRGMLNPERTIVAGHSMGGAMALQVGAHIPVAGVVAISPAPMQSAHGVSPEKLLFHYAGPWPQHLVVISGSLEPQSMRENDADLVSSRKDSAQYEEIPGATHVSLLFSSAAVRSFQSWTSKTLQLAGSPGLPSRRQLYGAVAGFLGLLLLANPFLREMAGQKQSAKQLETGDPIHWVRLLVEFAAAALIAVALLRSFPPLRSVRLFEGDYLATFFLILGIVLLLLRGRSLRTQFWLPKAALLKALLAGLILFLLFSAWFELSIYEAWATAARWARFPLLFVLLLPYHFAEEICLGPADAAKSGRRLATGLSLRLVLWAALVVGVFYLRSGEILLVLLVPYFALLFVLQRRGMDLVRQETGSAAAAAVFGAILLAGFSMVIFPIT
jgi:pimeloyl-ACP methyl ester carboxylesterase